MQVALENNIVFVVIEYLAILCWGLSGGLAAIRKGYDIFTIMLCGWLTALGGGLVRDVMKLKDQKLAGRFIYNIAKVALLVIYFIAVLTVLGIDTSSLVAVLAASSLAVSLALQSIMTNFASGMIIVGNKPFKEGDYISVGDYSGTVTNITLHSTTLVTPDNKVVIIPNSDISGGTVVNYSAMPERRLDLEFTVAYGTNIEKVKKVLTKVLEEHPLVLHDKDYNVRLSAEDASALRFICRCWVKNEDYWTVNFDLHENVVAAFKKANIEIPFNQLDVNIKK